MNPYLSVVIPAYNEATILPVALDCLRGFLSQQSFTAEVIVVDDGSADKTSALVTEWQPNFECLRVLRNSLNSGKGASIRRGILASRGEVIFVTDADLPGHPQDILRLLEALRKGAAIAIASRRPVSMSAAPSRSRFLASLIYRTLVRAVLNLPLRDTQCGFKAFLRQPLLPVVAGLHLDGFSFDVEFLYGAWKRGLSIQEVDFELVERRPIRHGILLQSPLMLIDLLRIRLTGGSLLEATPQIEEAGRTQNCSEGRSLARDCDLPHHN